MVDSDSLFTIVSKLLEQLESFKFHRQSPHEDEKPDDMNAVYSPQVGGDLEEYGVNIIQRILDMCSRGLYSNVLDFDWYVDVLIQLVGLVPVTHAVKNVDTHASSTIFDQIGSELRNVAVRVKSVRSHAVEAVGNHLSTLNQLQLIKTSGYGAYNILRFAAFIAAEYPGLLPDPSGTMITILLQFQHPPPPPPAVLTAFLQAVSKILGFVFSTELQHWSQQQRSMAELLLARIISNAGSYAAHENIDVQEHAVTLLELAKISEAALAKHASDELTAPTLLREILPALFTGQDLNPVAVSAQAKVQCPSDLDLDAPINNELITALSNKNYQNEISLSSLAKAFYNHREVFNAQQIGPLLASERVHKQIQHSEYYVENEESGLSFVDKARPRAERTPYDPFYISNSLDSKDRYRATCMTSYTTAMSNPSMLILFRSSS